MRNHLLILSAILIAAGMNVHAQSGGNFSITESVIASGGQETTGGMFSLDGTVGQSFAGDVISRAPFAVTSGFWNFTPLAPTAASVSVGGRVRTAAGQGIQNAFLTMISTNGSTRTARSSSFGFYRFEGVAVGETYVVSVESRRFTFGQPTVISVLDEIVGLDFIADSSP